MKKLNAEDVPLFKALANNPLFFQDSDNKRFYWRILELPNISLYIEGEAALLTLLKTKRHAQKENRNDIVDSIMGFIGRIYNLYRNNGELSANINRVMNSNPDMKPEEELLH